MTSLSSSKPPTWKEQSDRLSTALGFIVSRKQIRYWRALGYNLDDPDSLKISLSGQQRVYRLKFPQVVEHDRKRCSACKEVKKLDHFGANKAGEKGRQPQCRICTAVSYQRHRLSDSAVIKTLPESFQAALGSILEAQRALIQARKQNRYRNELNQ